MYKLFLHPTERKSVDLLADYMTEHPRIRNEFADFDGVKDLSNPDLLVKKFKYWYEEYKQFMEPIEKWNDHCAFEFKFGMDLVNSLNTHTLEDELTRMKRKYPDIPLYLVIVNEWKEIDSYDDIPDQPVISHIDLARAYSIAQDLNVRCVYCDDSHTFAKKVFSLIRTPPSEVDLGQRFVIKSSGSEFNRSLQCYHGVTRAIADKIEEFWVNWDDFIRTKNFDTELSNQEFKERLDLCFTTSSGRFMKANMEKFLLKVSGGERKVSGK